MLSFLALLVVVTVLSVIDEDVRLGHGFFWGMWGVSSLAAFAALSYRGLSVGEAAQLGAWVFFGAIVGSGFRPGLLTRFPFRNSEGKWGSSQIRVDEGSEAAGVE